MKIACFETEEWEKDILSKSFPGHEVSFFDGHATPDSVQPARNTEVLSTFIYSRLTADVLSLLPDLKLIVTRSTGYDHIDVSYCRDHGITVCNVPAYGVNTIAEHTFGLILALSRKLIPSVDRTRKGNFSLDGLRGFELAGKTIGIIGFGHIGDRVAELARAFRMTVLVTTRHPKTDEAARIGVSFVTLEDLLSASDIVTVHVPATAQTNHLINKNNIGRMKKGSFLINTSRGTTVETEAILVGLDNGTLAGVGLDVLEEECSLKEERQLLTREFLETCDLKTQIFNRMLLMKENVIITPHNAFNSTEALREIVAITTDDILAWTQGKPINVVQ